MKSQFLLPETVARHDGTGPETALEDSGSDLLLLTLGITRIIEQESLDLTIWGSTSTGSWIQIAAFPQKFYCGTYSLLVDLTQHSDVKEIRAQWKMARCGRWLAKRFPWRKRLERTKKLWNRVRPAKSC